MTKATRTYDRTPLPQRAKLKASDTTREGWLNVVKDHKLVRALFAAAGHPIPANVRVSVGWPYGGRKGYRIGECWSHKNSKDQHFEIFISPAIEGGLHAADILVHELVHAAVGLDKGHGPVFRKCALAVGLTGKMRETVAGDDLKATLAKVIKAVGGYPHAKLSAREQFTPGEKDESTESERSGPKKQGTRMIKVYCPGCGYTLRTTKKWIAVGLPRCCCGEFMECDAVAGCDDARMLRNGDVQVDDQITLRSAYALMPTYSEFVPGGLALATGPLTVTGVHRMTSGAESSTFVAAEGGKFRYDLKIDANGRGGYSIAVARYPVWPRAGDFQESSTRVEGVAMITLEQFSTVERPGGG